MIIIYILLALICAAAIYILLTMPRLKNPNHQEFLNWYYAHRGLHDNTTDAPENSLPAFRRAVEKGYGIELDVQLSKDMVPVVFHDFDLKRICGLEQKVSQLTLAELKELRLLHTDAVIPTLEEALAVVDGKSPLIIELKTNSLRPRLPRLVDNILQQYHGLYCIESFNPIVLRWYKLHRREIIRGQLSTSYLREFGYTNPVLFSLETLLCNVISRPDFISYNWKYRRRSTRRLCRKLYRTLSVGWTIKSREELELCRKDFDLFIFEGFVPKSEKKSA